MTRVLLYGCYCEADDISDYIVCLLLALRESYSPSAAAATAPVAERGNRSNSSQLQLDSAAAAHVFQLLNRHPQTNRAREYVGIDLLGMRRPERGEGSSS